MTTDAQRLHRSAVVIDSTCPLAADPRYVEWYREGGVTVVCPTIATIEGAGETQSRLAKWRRRLTTNTSLLAVRSSTDVRRAKAEGRTGVLFHFQNTSPIEGNLDLVDLYFDLGVQVVGLCYNTRNRVGDGAEEPTDAGLSRFGRDLIARMNEVGTIVDGSHTGTRTTLEAISASVAPVILSHSNPAGFHPSPRNAPDEVIRAIAENGGVIGLAGFPAFLVRRGQPTLARFIDAISYVVDLVGIDAVGIGLDYYWGQHGVASYKVARSAYDEAIAVGKWTAGSYPPPPHRYPAGVETPRQFPNLTPSLLDRGFGESEIRKILGENWLRVWAQVWG